MGLSTNSYTIMLENIFLFLSAIFFFGGIMSLVADTLLTPKIKYIPIEKPKPQPVTIEEQLSVLISDDDLFEIDEELLKQGTQNELQ